MSSRDHPRFMLPLLAAYFGLAALALVAITVHREPVAAPPTITEAPPASEPAAIHVVGKHVEILATAGECHVGAECALTITLVPRNEFHLSAEFPHKLTASETPFVRFLGNAGHDGRAFRAPPSFVNASSDATMTVRFVPQIAGNAQLEGKLRTALCDDKECWVETPSIFVEVPVT